MRWWAASAALAMSVVATSAEAGTVTRASFGTLADGREVAAVTLTNGHGMKAVVIAWGAALQQLWVPDQNGKLTDITLGRATLKDYVDKREYFGATVGRFANRLARGRFTLDGAAYQLATNNGPNALHGGEEGFDRKLWDVVEVVGGATPHVTLRLDSPDGDQGYPGDLTVTATYTLDDANQLTIDYRATTTKPTIVNLSNHAYWNLAGEDAPRSALDALLTIPAERFTPVDATLIPTGEKRAVAGTVFDFRARHVIADRVRDARDEQIVFGHGYDHNFILADAVAAQPHLMARVEDRASGRTMELWSNQPGLQFYSGNFLDATTVGKSGTLYRQGDAIALEPQIFPDSPNQRGFPNARLAPGETYHNQIIYKFTAAPKPS